MCCKPNAHSTKTHITILSVILILCSTSMAFAQLRYIKPSSEIVVRRGQGNELKIIAMVKDGTQVELLETSKTHAKIRLINGKEGWILKRFLSDGPPLEAIVASLRAEKEEALLNEEETTLKYNAVSTTLAQTEEELDSVLQERDQLKEKFLQLQKDTENVVQMKNDLQQNIKKNQELSGKISVLQLENSTLKNNIALKWFLAGGGVLVVGMIIGSIFSKSRKRRPSLL